MTCSFWQCGKPGTAQVAGKTYCWAHAKRTAGWQEGYVPNGNGANRESVIDAVQRFQQKRKASKNGVG